MEKQRKNKVVVAMSGGVDSSVAAALLKKQGYNVIGAFMRFWKEPGYGENRCCSPETEARARKTAKILDIPFYVFNFEKEFKKRVVDYFLDGYKKGITPNPCVACNKEIKFGLLLEKVLELNADYIATGHYARIKNNCLLMAKDKNKDQSYFLWQLNQKQLKRILFPIGDYTKDKIKELAKKFNLPVLGISESMEVCFIKTTLNDFLTRRLKLKPGSILTVQGKKIGMHKGLSLYTIGQRKGIELSGGPFYVVGKDLKKNALIVTSFLKDNVLDQKIMKTERVNWVSGKIPKLPLKAKVQIRYGHNSVSATIKKIKNKNYEIIFSRPQRAITPGQSAVFYLKDELLGGGIII